MTLSDADILGAEKRLHGRLRTLPRATGARCDRRAAKVIVRLSSGIELGVPVRMAQGLSGASHSELVEIPITPTGLGRHWPQLDADRYLPAPIEGIFGTRRWMAAHAGQATAARANGRLGGRARKAAHA